MCNRRFYEDCAVRLSCQAATVQVAPTASNETPRSSGAVTGNGAGGPGGAGSGAGAGAHANSKASTAHIPPHVSERFAAHGLLQRESGKTVHLAGGGDTPHQHCASSTPAKSKPLCLHMLAHLSRESARLCIKCGKHRSDGSPPQFVSFRHPNVFLTEHGPLGGLGGGAGAGCTPGGAIPINDVIAIRPPKNVSTIPPSTNTRIEILPATTAPAGTGAFCNNVDGRMRFACLWSTVSVLFAAEKLTVTASCASDGALCSTDSLKLLDASKPVQLTSISSWLPVAANVAGAALLNLGGAAAPPCVRSPATSFAG